MITSHHSSTPQLSRVANRLMLIRYTTTRTEDRATISTERILIITETAEQGRQDEYKHPREQEVLFSP
jgi:hypothetical protein